MVLEKCREKRAATLTRSKRVSTAQLPDLRNCRPGPKPCNFELPSARSCAECPDDHRYGAMSNPSATAPLIEEAITLARELQGRATQLQTSAERRQQSELDRMLQTPADKVTLIQLTDQAFRSRVPGVPPTNSLTSSTFRACHVFSARSIGRCCAAFKPLAAGCPGSRCRW